MGAEGPGLCKSSRRAESAGKSRRLRPDPAGLSDSDGCGD